MVIYRGKPSEEPAVTLSALLFDVDGTLADTEETHRQAFNAAFLEFRLPYEWSPDQYEVLLNVSGGKERLARFFEGLPASREERAACWRTSPGCTG